MNSMTSGIVFYVLGLFTGVLTPLATNNVSAALGLRKKIDDVLFDLDGFLKYKPRDLRNIQADFAVEMATDLRKTLESMRWYLVFQFLLGLPSKKDLRAAIDKLSEITSRLQPKPGLADFDRMGESLPIGREVKELLRRRWSVF